MGDVENLKDWRILQIHAQSQGYSLRDYMQKGKEAGLDKAEIIASARDDICLDELIRLHNKDVKRSGIVRRAVKMASATAGAMVFAYTLNFAVMLSSAFILLPDDYGAVQAELNDKKARAEAMAREDAITGGFNPHRTVLAYDIAGLYNGLEPELRAFDERIYRAFNPVLHFGSDHRIW